MAESVTRFGVLAVAIYLVQILINLYRYNTRLAAYYLAHRDTLLLQAEEPERLSALHQRLWPDLQYGRVPSTIPTKIVESMADAWKAVSDSVAKRSAQGAKVDG